MPHTYVYRYDCHVEGMVKINQRPSAELQFRPAAYAEPECSDSPESRPLQNA